MKIFNNLAIPNKYKGSAIAIGNFDGVHRGHQKVFQQAKKLAKKNKIKFGVLTFTPLPIMFFNKKISNYRLMSENQKFKNFRKHGVDFLINVKFNKSFSQISAIKFIKSILYKKINPKLIFVSNNFKFGNKRKGNVHMLKKFGKKYNYKLIKINPFKHQGKIISSTAIRKYLRFGNLDLANKLLSRTWFIDGVVESGKKLGRKLGYRTCNISIKNYILPKTGIYAVKVMINKKNKVHNGIAYLGSRPTFDGKKILLETNIFNFKKNIYKKKLSIFFLKFIRKDQKFDNSIKLITQMNKDVIIAKKGLKETLVI
jgi:riboflavin kinase / FMN adenylyltransferase